MKRRSRNNTAGARAKNHGSGRRTTGHGSELARVVDIAYRAWLKRRGLPDFDQHMYVHTPSGV